MSNTMCAATSNSFGTFLADSVCSWTQTISLFVCRIILVVFIPAAAFAATAAPTAPSFLPSYYSDVLKIDGRPLELVSQDEKEGVKVAMYKSASGDVLLNVEQIICDRPRCEAFYEQTLKAQNDKLTPLDAQFLSGSNAEFSVAWNEKSMRFLRYVAKVPKAFLSWTWITHTKKPIRDEGHLVALRRALNHQRYDEAIQMDNVEIGRWAKEIHQHARDLISEGKTEEAVAVLQQVITWSPTSFDAQLDFAEKTRDPAAARASAQAVWDNAENPEFAARASKLLGFRERAPMPVLEAGLRGLQLVLIPIAPCDERLLEEAGRLYSESFKVPVRIARLPNAWQWGQPDRVYREREIRSLIQHKSSKPIDFGGWTKDMYANRLATTTTKEDALSRFRVRTFLEEFTDKPGQYRAEPYVDRLIDRVAPLRSDDRRTMIVGVTEADIFSGDTNFIFSGAASKNGNWAGILSYARMQAASLNEPYESRKRLTERLAKELVPASLKQLGIPRPTDPADPYSYSSGTERLAQKTLTLSAPTREALDRFRNP